MKKEEFEEIIERQIQRTFASNIGMITESLVKGIPAGAGIDETYLALSVNAVQTAMRLSVQTTMLILANLNVFGYEDYSRKYSPPSLELILPPQPFEGPSPQPPEGQ